VENGDMPPPKAKPLAAKDKDLVASWVDHALEAIGEPGDPGQVTMRRLTNAEYDYTVRDLTGQNYGFGKEFQSDGGGGEGFSNTGDVLFLSPRQLDQYFAAARQIADRATILPGSGIQFQPQRIGLRGPEQWKAQAQQGLYVWYQQKSAPFLPTDTDDMREADYMIACWKHKHFQEPLDKLAKDAGLRPQFLSNWWNLVNSTEPKSRFLDLTRAGGERHRVSGFRSRNLGLAPHVRHKRQTFLVRQPIQNLHLQPFGLDMAHAGRKGKTQLCRLVEVLMKNRLQRHITCSAERTVRSTVWVSPARTRLVNHHIAPFFTVQSASAPPSNNPAVRPSVG
jgi:hypothetical protein